MTDNDALEVLGWLEDEAIHVWVDGGWGVDALVGEQTRLHTDLDLALDRDDVDLARQMAAALANWPRVGRYSAEDLNATGAIAGRPVRCLSPLLQLRFRMGYEWSERDEHDIRLLIDRFGVPAPPFQ